MKYSLESASLALRIWYTVGMENKIATDGISFNSSWIHQLYQRGPRTVEMTLKTGATYFIGAEFPAQLDEWFAAKSKGKWFLRNQDRLDIARSY